MRAIVLSLVVICVAAPAASEQWALRTGQCFEWQGYATMEREPSGVWTGTVDFQNVGGPCVAPTNNIAVNEMRAAIVGEDFFGYRLGAGGACYMHGRARGGQARGFELCQGVPQPMGFALSFTRP